VQQPGQVVAGRAGLVAGSQPAGIGKRPTSLRTEGSSCGIRSTSGPSPSGGQDRHRDGPAQAPRDNEWLLPQLAAHLGCATGTLRNWLRDGLLTGRQETRAPHRWILLAPPEKVDELRHRLARARGRTTRVHPRFAEALNGHIPQAQSA
jgi:hypothetical protein